MGDDRPDVYLEGSQVIFRASSFGACTKMLAALRMGYEPTPVPAATREIFAAGNVAEEVAIERLRAMGYAIWGQQKEFDLGLTGRLIVRCHVDGMIRPYEPGKSERVLEIKSQGQDAWDEFHKSGWAGGLWPKYMWQVSAVMHATGKPAVVVRINRDDQEEPLAIEFIDQPFHALGDLRARAVSIEQIVYKGALPEVCDRPSFPCPVFRLHDDKLEMAVAIDDAEIDLYAREYDKARGMVKTWEGIKDAARKALRLGIVDDKIRTRSGVTVSFATTTTSRLNERKMREELGDDMVSRFVEVSFQERINVRMPKGEGDDDK